MSPSLQANAQATMTTLETALTSISDELSRAGAYENRFSHTIAVQELTAKAQKLHVVESWMPMPKSPPGSQSTGPCSANTAMLAQANQSERVLALFN